MPRAASNVLARDAANAPAPNDLPWPAAGRRFRLADAARYADPFAAYLPAFVAGSYRRMQETVADLDFVAASDDPAAVVERFVHYFQVDRVTARSAHKASVVLKCGIPCELRVVAPECFGAALQYFTGSRAHIAAMRELAVTHGLRMSEHGVFRGRRRIAGDTEESVYAALGLPYIAPEMREDEGEIQAALRGRLPRLVCLEDLRGDLHVHTRATDGRSSLAEMVAAAKSAGLAYLAITDHSRGERTVHGLDAERLARQCAEIDALNRAGPGIRVLKGIEVDIREDGTLDLPDRALARLDVVIAAVHTRLDLPRERQTARVLAALDNPHVDILAHPTGRLLERREAYDVSMLAVVRKARDRGVALELNAHSDRFDLSDVHCRLAREEGAVLAINSDAHAASGLTALRYGIGQARRAWLTAGDVLNTRSPKELAAWLEARRAIARAVIK